MNLFFDTSALVKYYLPEIGSDKVEQLVEDSLNTIWISELLKVEFQSALFRRLRNRELSESEVLKAISGFEQSIRSFYIHPLNSLVLHDAESLLKLEGINFPIRTLDALHFSSFRLLEEKDWAFVTADTPFANFVVQLGHQVINPLSI